MTTVLYRVIFDGTAWRVTVRRGDQAHARNLPQKYPSKAAAELAMHRLEREAREDRDGAQ